MSSCYVDNELREYWRTRHMGDRSALPRPDKWHKARVEANERDARRQAVLDRLGLTESSSRIMLSRVAGHQIAERATYIGDEVSWGRTDLRRCLDHTAIHYHRGTDGYVITSQPYDMSADDYAALREFCQQHGCDAQVYPSLGWHYPGAAALVVIHRTDVPVADLLDGFQIDIRGQQ